MTVKRYDQFGDEALKDSWPVYVSEADYKTTEQDMRYWRSKTIEYQELLKWIRQNTDVSALDEIDDRIDAALGVKTALSTDA